MNKPSCYALILFIISIFTATPLLAKETLIAQPAYQTGKATIAFGSSPLKTMTETPFAINISDIAGVQISDAKLSISMDMPAMPMPPNNPVATWDNGAYRGRAIFTMAGAWRITVNIQSPKHGQEVVVFDVERVMMK